MISWLQKEGVSSYALYVMNADGSGQRYLTPVTTNFSSEYSWAPDSKKIAFTGGGGISVINADGTNLTVLPNTAEDDDPKTGGSKNPAWSPDGSTIVFARGYLIGYDMRLVIYLMNADGSNQRRVIAPEDPDDPDFVLDYGDHHNAFYWSPDGSKIAFHREYLESWNPKTGLYVINADGTKATQIMAGGGWWEYKWSPDSEKIAYRNYPSGIAVINADGSNKIQLTTNTSDVMPNWSPDGKKIAFSSNRVGDYPASEVYVMDAEGKGLPKKITVNQVYDGNPAWKPLKACDCDTVPKPQSQTVQSNWHAVNGINVNWSVDAEVTENDGLVLSNIRLGSRYLAKRISVPYYILETSAFAKKRSELKPNSSDTLMRSRLIGYEVITNEEKLVVEATYAIDQISQSCLEIRQRYEFYKQVPGDLCEPSGELPCSRWSPTVKYKFWGGAGETIKNLNIAQRQHLQIDGNPYNTVGLFKDCDYPLSLTRSCLRSQGGGGQGGIGDIGFERSFNPLEREWSERVISNGKSTDRMDNVHQTYKGIVDEPSLRLTLNPQNYYEYGPIEAGCPECDHSHWRWGADTGGEGGGRLVKIPPGSTQDMDIAIVVYKDEEVHPSPYYEATELANFHPVRTEDIYSRDPLQRYWNTAPEAVVFWQSAIGHKSSDTFFAYGHFFNPSLPNVQLYGSGSFQAAESAYVSAASEPTSGSSASADSSSEGLTSVTAANLYGDGETTVTPLDLTQVPALPQGYTPLNALNFDVQTEAIVSGPMTAVFNAASISDQTVFNNLRVFHLEQDPYDPERVVWVDRTVLPSDFATKTLTAKTTRLGPYIVASLTQPQPVSTAVADLAVTGSVTPDPVMTGNNQTYTLSITNNGPQDATDVIFTDSLPPNLDAISINTSQGTCTAGGMGVPCKLGTLVAGASATVTIIARTDDDGTYPTSGKVVSSTIRVRATESDSNLSNNTLVQGTTVLPDSNRAPVVEIITPGSGRMFAGQATIYITAKASDGDGSISKVDFLDNGELIGTGTSIGSDQYRIELVSPAFGPHSLTAIAKDNAGKTSISNAANILVNGLASVSITSPAAFAEFTVPANITLNAAASYPGGSISKVDFYADGVLVGAGAPDGTGQYSINWSCAGSGAHILTAVVTDSSGVSTTSAPVRVYGNLKRNAPPAVDLSNPTGGAVITTPGNVTLTANASDADGSVSKVDFYANEALIGAGTTTGGGQYNFTWTNPPRGDYVLTAVAWDNEGAATVSAGTNITTRSSALLVTGSTTLSQKDSAVKSRLEARGFTVTVKDGTAVTSADATGKGVVVISSTVTPTAVGTKFRNVAVPVVLWESGLFPNMGMTGSTSKDYGTASRQLQISIINSASPLAAGLSGSPQVYSVTSGALNWGTPGAGAAKVATVIGSPTKVVIFGYESGAQMSGLVAPAKRAGFYMDDATSVSYEGWLLFDAAINWATSMP